jgi:MFS family permease
MTSVMPWKPIVALELQYFSSVFNFTVTCRQFTLPVLLYFPDLELSYMLCLMLAAFQLGRCVGAPFWLYLSSRVKQSILLLYPSILAGVATTFLGFTTGAWSISALRFISGFFTTVPLLVLVKAT